MKKFYIDKSLYNIFPDACFGVVVVRDMNNKCEDNSVYKEMLIAAEKNSHKHISEDPITFNPVIAVWREAFKKFRTKKGARSSIEALLKRVKQGQHINSINPLVDIYNSISLIYGMSCGAEDADTFVGDLRITVADGTESFCLIGSDENEPPLPGEIVYKDDAGAVCRCFNWRESKRTMITDDSKNAFLCIELVNKERMEELKEAIKTLAYLIRNHLVADVSQYIISQGSDEVIIE